MTLQEDKKEVSCNVWHRQWDLAASPGNQSPFCSTSEMETRAPRSLHTATCLDSLSKLPTSLHAASCGQRVTCEEDCRRYSLGKRRLFDKTQGVIIDKEETQGLTLISRSEKWWGTGKGQAGAASGQWGKPSKRSLRSRVQTVSKEKEWATGWMLLLSQVQWELRMAYVFSNLEVFCGVGKRTFKGCGG